METFELIYEYLVAILDYPLGWMLFLGRDLSITVLAAGTAVVMLLLRKRVSDQHFLRLCAEDRATLKRRAREAKASGDKALAKRLRSVSAMLSLKTLAREGKPLLAAMIPIILLASWAYARLGNVPPQSNEVVTVSADLAPGKVGFPVYIIPQPGVSAVDGWVQFPEAAEAEFGGEDVARAIWNLRFEPSEETYHLRIRAGEAEQRLSMLVDQRIYATSERFLYQPVFHSIKTHLEERKFLGIVPGFPSVAIPPWLFAYLLLAIPFYFIFKKLLRVY